MLLKTSDRSDDSGGKTLKIVERIDKERVAPFGEFLRGVERLVVTVSRRDGRRGDVRIRWTRRLYAGMYSIEIARC